MEALKLFLIMIFLSFSSSFKYNEYLPKHHCISSDCSKLPASCYDCKQDFNCEYGTMVNFNCTVSKGSSCPNNGTFLKKFQCRYCFLTKPFIEHKCTQRNSSCNVYASPKQFVKSNCITAENVFCLGNRVFSKKTLCNWTSGYSWITSVLLSLTLGGFGADRFYLGYWEEGLGKLFSFGGLGVWTLIDFLLILTGHLTPSDGSLYVT